MSEEGVADVLSALEVLGSIAAACSVPKDVFLSAQVGITQEDFTVHLSFLHLAHVNNA